MAAEMVDRRGQPLWYRSYPSRKPGRASARRGKQRCREKPLKGAIVRHDTRCRFASKCVDCHDPAGARGNYGSKTHTAALLEAAARRGPAVRAYELLFCDAAHRDRSGAHPHIAAMPRTMIDDAQCLPNMEISDTAARLSRGDFPGRCAPADESHAGGGASLASAASAVTCRLGRRACQFGSLIACV